MVFLHFEQDVVTFEMINSTNAGASYFYLDRDTGMISVRASLERDNNFVNEYFVSKAILTMNSL